MARIDRLQDKVTALQDDVTVLFGAVGHAERKEENTGEELRSLTTLVCAMKRQIQHLPNGTRTAWRVLTFCLSSKGLSNTPIGWIMAAIRPPAYVRRMETAA